MVKERKPEEVLLEMLKDMLVAAYTLLVFLATGTIILGKFVFDGLYELVKAKREHDKAKAVECPIPRKD
jgi:hypothetical protein